MTVNLVSREGIDVGRFCDPAAKSISEERHGPTQPDHEHTRQRTRSEFHAPTVRSLGTRALRANSGCSARLPLCLPALPGQCPRLDSAKGPTATEEEPTAKGPAGTAK